MTSLLLSNSVVPGIMTLIDLGYLWPLLRQYIFKKYPEKRIQLTQQEANILFEKPKLNAAYRYAADIKTLMFSTFYAFIIPIAPILGIANLLFSYIVYKYMIIRRMSRPLPVGGKLALEMIDNFLEMVILVIFKSSRIMVFRWERIGIFFFFFL